MIKLKRSFYLFFIFALGICVFSCQKMFLEDIGQETMSAVAENPALLETARQYYKKELRKQVVSGIKKKYKKSVGVKLDGDDVNNEPAPRVHVLWKRGYTTVFGREQVAEVPPVLFPPYRLPDQYLPGQSGL